MSAPRMTVFAQGMRRSGTTLLYDLMLESGGFLCFYEPFARGKPAFGGGSGMHGEQDLFATLRRAREEFLARNPEWLERYPGFVKDNLFNHGAPRDPELEFETGLPDYGRAYLAFLCAAGPRTFMKFTRMHSKVPCLKQIAPGAKFIHIVRDPRHVAASYLFGRNARYRGRFRDPDLFFTRISDATAWSSRAFSDHLLRQREYAALGQCEDFLRVLLIWKYSFETTHRYGRLSFGDDYLLFRHDDFLAAPLETLRRLEGFLGEDLGAGLREWARSNVRPQTPPYADGDPRWQTAFGRLMMDQALVDAGYHALLQ